VKLRFQRSRPGPGSNGRSLRIWRSFSRHGREFMGLHDKVKVANRRGKEILSSTPRATSAYYDKRTGRIVIQLNTKLDVAFRPQDAQGLVDARAFTTGADRNLSLRLGYPFPKTGRGHLHSCSARGFSRLEALDGRPIRKSRRTIQESGEGGRRQTQWTTWRPTTKENCRGMRWIHLCPQNHVVKFFSLGST
jgi:hypothetical protein